MGKFLSYRGWNLMESGYFTPELLRELFDQILSGEYDKGQALKKHHRSIVSRFRFSGKELIHKVPLEKNNRPWIRFTTLYRKGEAFRNLEGMEFLAASDIPSTVPVMAAEKRTLGMVTDSFVIYEYLDGIPCTGREEYFPKVVDRLSSMHAKGILHGDSQIQNFIFSSGKVYVIDCNPSPVKNTFQQASEFAYLQRSAPGIEKYFGPLSDSAEYRKAAEKLAFERRLAHTRRRFKRMLGFTPKEG